MFRCCFFFLCLIRTPLIYSLFPYTTLFRSGAILLGSVMVINFILAFTVIFLERKNASSTWAWIMVLFFIPILGFILYLILDRKSTRLNSSHVAISYAVFCLKKKMINIFYYY